MNNVIHNELFRDNVFIELKITFISLLKHPDIKNITK